MSEQAKDRVEFLWKVHSYTNDYIKFADTKAAFIITAVGGLIAALVSSRVLDDLHRLRIGNWSAICWVALVSLALLVASFVSSLAVITPRLASSTTLGLIFWNHIKKHEDSNKFTKSINSQSTEQIESEVSRHVYDLAGVCGTKYRWIKMAIYTAIPGGILAGITVLASHVTR